MTLEKMQYNARLGVTHENVSSRTRPSFLAAPAVGGTFLLLLLAAASYAQTVRTADAQAFVSSELEGKIFCEAIGNVVVDIALSWIDAVERAP